MNRREMKVVERDGMGEEREREREGGKMKRTGRVDGRMRRGVRKVE